MSERPIAYPKGTVKYLGTEARGVKFKIAPGLPLLGFGDEPGTKKHIRKFNMDKKEEREIFEAVLDSTPFKKGEIIYVKSPDEIKAMAKAKKQAEKLEILKNALETGVLTVTDMNKKTSPELFDLADSIGAECTYYNKASDKHQSLRKEILIKNIRELLGLPQNMKEKEQEQTAPVN